MAGNIPPHEIRLKPGLTSVTPQEREEIKMAQKFADEREKEIAKMIKEIEGMWNLRMRWDRKVPQNDKMWYYFFTLKSSKREDIIAEIKKYVEFYKEMSAAVHKVYTSEGKSEKEETYPQEIIAELRKKLENMLAEAESGESLTSSSIVYDLHRGFISDREKLDCMVKNVQIVSLKDGVKTLDGNWKESLGKIDVLSAKHAASMIKTDQLSNRLEALSVHTEHLVEDNKQQKKEREEEKAEWIRFREQEREEWIRDREQEREEWIRDRQQEREEWRRDRKHFVENNNVLLAYVRQQMEERERERNRAPDP